MDSQSCIGCVPTRIGMHDERQGCIPLLHIHHLGPCCQFCNQQSSPAMNKVFCHFHWGVWTNLAKQHSSLQQMTSWLSVCVKRTRAKLAVTSETRRFVVEKTDCSICGTAANSKRRDDQTIEANNTYQLKRAMDCFGEHLKNLPAGMQKISYV